MPRHDIDAIRSDLDFLDDWEERYRYIIDLGRGLEAMSEEEHDEIHKVRGCASQVWLISERVQGPDGEVRLHFRGDSDAHIVKGLVALAIALFSERTPQEILATDALAFFKAIGLKEHLTPQRSNGLASMVERMRSDARQAL